MKKRKNGVLEPCTPWSKLLDFIVLEKVADGTGKDMVRSIMADCDTQLPRELPAALKRHDRLTCPDDSDVVDESDEEQPEEGAATP